MKLFSPFFGKLSVVAAPALFMAALVLPGQSFAQAGRSPGEAGGQSGYSGDDGSRSMGQGHESHSHYHGILAKQVGLDEYLGHPNKKQNAKIGEYTVTMTTVFFQGARKELSGLPFRTKFLVNISSGGKDQVKMDSDHEGKDGLKTKTGGPHTGHMHSGGSKTQQEVSRPYFGKLKFFLLNNGGAEFATYEFDSPIRETTYEIGHYFPWSGEYRARVEFTLYGAARRVEFPVEIKVDGASAIPIYLGAVFVAGFTFALVLINGAKT